MQKKQTIESLIEKLKLIAEKLEEDIGIEKSIKLYEEAQELSKICQEKLDKAEKKLTIIKS